MWNKDKKITIVSSIDELEQINHHIEKAEYLAVDTETDGLSRFCKGVGVSIAWNEDEGCYIPLRKFSQDKGLYSAWDEADTLYIRDYILYWLSSKKLILHNAVFDARVFLNEFKYDIIPRVHCDTMCLAHTVYNEEGPLSLKDLAATLLDPDAKNPQNEVKESVKANGGKTTKDEYEMYKCDTAILGRYAVYDTLYTYGLFNKLYPEIDKQKLRALWEDEIKALMPVTFELNNNGLPVDVAYFNKLKTDIELKILDIERDIYSNIQHKVADYELNRVKEELTITHRSECGKYLVKEGVAVVEGEGREKALKIINESVANNLLINFYKKRKGIERIFNLDSNADKGHLIYTVLELPQDEITKSGNPSTKASTLDELAKNYNEPTLNKLRQRSAERKILSTYVEPILEHNIDGVIYTGFNQCGTTSGRYSSSKPINLQTAPKKDLRIKRGLISGNDHVFVSADYSSLEPRAFAAASNEPNLIKVYDQDFIDLYSQAGIDILGITGVNADERSPNCLKTVYPDIRQKMKVAVLARCYGSGPGRLAEVMKTSYEEAMEFCRKYDEAYPTLKKWIETIKFKIKVHGNVSNLVGRKRRAPLVNSLYTKYGIQNFTKKEIQILYSKLPKEYKDEYENHSDLYYACKNNFDNAVNFSIQSLAASICNRAMILFNSRAKEQQLNAKIVLQVHDSITIRCRKEDAEITAKLLQDCMEHNEVTKLISVKMKAEPIIGTSLVEDKA